MCEHLKVVLVVGAPLPDRVPVCFRVVATLLRPERSAGLLRTAALAHRRPHLRTSAPFFYRFAPMLTASAANDDVVPSTRKAGES